MARTCARWRLHAHLGGSAPGVKRDSGSLFASRRLDSGAAYAAGTGRSMDLFGMAYATDRRHCHWSRGKVRSRDPPCASPLGGDRLGRRALGDRFRRLPCFDGSERGASALPVLGLVEARSSRKGSLKLIKVSGYMAHKNGVCNCHNELLDRE